MGFGCRGYQTHEPVKHPQTGLKISKLAPNKPDVQNLCVEKFHRPSPKSIKKRLIPHIINNTIRPLLQSIHNLVNPSIPNSITKYDYLTSTLPRQYKTIQHYLLTVEKS